MKTFAVALIGSLTLLGLGASGTAAQALGGAAPANQVEGDPGIYSMAVINGDGFLVLRDYAEPGATRRMHNHEWAIYHTLTVVSGSLRLTVDGEESVIVGPGDVAEIPGAAMHTFTNVGTDVATIVEVFGRLSLNRPPG